jgi:hypothetical protein
VDPDILAGSQTTNAFRRKKAEAVLEPPVPFTAEKQDRHVQDKTY